MIFNIAITDDSSKDAEALSDIITEYSALNGIEADIEYYDNAEKLLVDYAPLKYTVIFMDIFMVGINGIEAARSIKAHDRNATIVFLTTSTDFMPDAFSLHAYDYITKPISKDRVFKLMDDISLAKTEDSVSLSIIQNGTELRIRYNDILSVRSNGHYLIIIDKSMTEHKTRMTFSAVSDILSTDSRFLAINRGMLVNMDYITSFSDGICQLNDTVLLPLNIKKHKELERTYTNYMFSKIRSNMNRRES